MRRSNRSSKRASPAKAANASPALRWWLFSNYGAQRMCPEMLKRGVALRLSERSPAIGRFFPTQCTHDVNDDTQTVTVHFAGTGYGFIQPAKRVGFSCTASIELRADFQIAGDDVYVWGKLNRIVQGPDFKLGYVENSLVDAAATFTPVGAVANYFGNQIVTGELTRGFTVVHNEDAGDSFALGVLYPPSKPFHPFDVTNSQFYTFANETVEIHGNQRDYLGPFELTDMNQSLFMRITNEGPPIDLMIVSKLVGDLWRESYQTGKQMGPPPGPVLGGDPIPTGQHTRTYKLPPGIYYVVLDNTQYAGTQNPPFVPFNPLSDSVARVSYVAQLVE
jgi:hypothetical protein